MIKKIYIKIKKNMKTVRIDPTFTEKKKKGC